MTADDAAAFRVLTLATRVADTASAEELRHAAGALTSWAILLQLADAHGMEPLLAAHLERAAVDVPRDAALSLRARCLRLAHACTVRARVIGEVCRAFSGADVPVLALKGAALAPLVYPHAQQRPMRDVDLLVPQRVVQHAVAALRDLGFRRFGVGQPVDYHHRQAMARDCEGVTISIELHTELLRRTAWLTPQTYESLADRAQPCEIGGVPMRAPGREDMLWHVYAHAFVINVLRPGIRLVSLADLAHIVYQWGDRLDWADFHRRYRRAARALAVFEDAPVRDVSSSTAADAVLSRDVLWPPDWWFRARYGVSPAPIRLWYRLVAHPARVLLAAAATAHRRIAARGGIAPR